MNLATLRYDQAKVELDRLYSLVEEARPWGGMSGLMAANLKTALDTVTELLTQEISAKEEIRRKHALLTEALEIIEEYVPGFDVWISAAEKELFSAVELNERKSVPRETWFTREGIGQDGEPLPIRHTGWTCPMCERGKEAALLAVAEEEKALLEEDKVDLKRELQEAKEERDLAEEMCDKLREAQDD